MVQDETGPVKAFEEWVKENFQGKKMSEPPSNWDRSRELYYKMGDLYYGPILFDQIPSRLR